MDLTIRALYGQSKRDTKMEANSRCFLIIIILPFKILNADEINYLDIVESLDTFKILEELAESLEPDTPCSKDIKEYVNNLMLDKPWALQSKCNFYSLCLLSRSSKNECLSTHEKGATVLASPTDPLLMK